jgi:uncharacterized protein YciI
MQFDSYTVSLLILRQDAPGMDEDEQNRLQDAHLAHLADLHDEGKLLMVGPLLGPDERIYRGLSIWRMKPDDVRREAEQDPGVKAGRYRVEVLPWMVPAGAADFKHTRLPRSIADATSG